MRDAFHDQIIAALPRLRIQALALTRGRYSEAEDLLQDTVAKALAARDTFEPGTNFAAWTTTIQRNHFFALSRQRWRHTGGLDTLPEEQLAVPAGAQEDRLRLGELAEAVKRLPARCREALFLVALQGMLYHEVAEATGCSVGTVKSRVYRARASLQGELMGRALPRGVGRLRRVQCAHAADSLSHDPPG